MAYCLGMVLGWCGLSGALGRVLQRFVANHGVVLERSLGVLERSWGVLERLGAVLGRSWAVLGRSWGGLGVILGRPWRLMINDRRPMIDEVVNEGVDEMSMSVSRDNDTEIDLQGQDEFHQQGQRAKQKHQNPKEETLY